ncbi:metal-dependent transcriptional regulator [Streptomonospora wellingtoniae]|uniref:Manganese transport regulator n=1 Tax=Streptomonospora wellingtoniae TaxID=3075544 RepID=A0ABU2KWU2_9ACTN|nr:metal-dependent transcriptional regulator [Streptomonospora sp. DSM 45055]MDT0303771.1 metal-dependent transcriptional regulator [Streptomonospora sp. DSM 45055]
MENASERPSTSVEDYVKVIYDLQERGSGPVTISAMAERLSVSNSSVSGMLRKLGELGLVSHRRYGDVRLTETGDKAALAVLRRHRLLETYLVEALGYSWDEVHDEAEILEHVVSDRFVDRIAAYLGDPAVDPHGDPIPTREGSVPERETQLLSAADEGTTGVIVRVNDSDPDLLRHLAEQDIGIGMRVELVERRPFGGPLIVRTGAPGEQREQALGLVAAEAVWVAPAHEHGHTGGGSGEGERGPSRPRS